MKDKLHIAQVAHDSEWALAKFFKALRYPGIEEIIQLDAICGVNPGKIEAIKALTNGITNRLGLIQNGNFNRGDNRLHETESALFLTIGLASEEIAYYPVRGNNSLPQNLYANGIKAVVIHSVNPSHWGYIIDAANHGRHVLCEKPVVPVLDETAEPTMVYLEKLKACLENHPELVFMDAEHYSHKQAPITFYENLETLLKNRKIKSIEGQVLEKDDPNFPRTRSIISPRNKTGLMGDVMCHLLAFVSNLGARATPIRREFDSYSDPSRGIEYIVDTYDQVDFQLENLNREHFTNRASANFKIGKFIDLSIEPTADKKYIKFTLEDDSTITLELGGENRVLLSDHKGEREYQAPRRPNPCEYVNILRGFYAAIHNGDQPRTYFGNSIKSLEAIHQAYCLDAKDNRQVAFYKK
jgi:predicted dehydrogenase